MEEPLISPQLIEQLLNEFHFGNTNNVRKREIESQLVHFQNHPTSWTNTIYQLSNITNQYVWFFNVSTIELTISRRWNTLRPPERNQIREIIWSNFIQLHENEMKIKREKFAQLLALIGKREFPNDNCVYMNHVNELMTKNCNLGIALLKATSNELVSTKDDVSFDTKKKFHSALSQCIPEVFELLNKFLMISCYRINNSTSLDSNLTLFQSLAAAMPSNDHLFCASVADLLTCIQHLFTWVVLDDVVSEQLIFSLFDLANWRECASDISVAALAAISELFYRQMALPRVTSIAKGIKIILEQNDLKKSNELYQDRLTELLKLFTSQHWTQWLHNEDFCDVVTSLYHFTISGYGALAFTERLSIWCPIIQGLASSGFNGYRRYEKIVYLLIPGILRKMQFRFDQDAELDILDNESLDDNMETEWQHYLSQCIETIVLIAEARPVKVFEQVYNEWQRPFEMFMSLEKSHDGSSLTITDYHKCHLIHCVTRDLSSLCQTLASLIPILQTYPDDMPANLQQLAFNIVYAIDFLSRNKLHTLHVQLPQLSTSFIDIHAQLLSAMRCFLGWSPALKSDTEFKRLIENVADALRPTTNLTQEPKLITLAAAQLLLSITSMIRSKHMLECQSFGQLIQYGNNLTHLDKYAATCVQQSIVNYFVLPWAGVSNVDQDFERRSLLLKEYIECLAQDLLRLDHTVENGQDNKIAKITETVLPPLKDILDYFKDQTSSVKQMLLAAYKHIIAKTTSLFSNMDMANSEIVTCVLNFFLSVIRTLQIQLGTSHVNNMLEWFLGIATRNQLTSCSLKAIDKLLQMLLFVVEQPGNASLSLLPNILAFVLDIVMPLLMEQKQSLDFSDVATSVFNLFHGILQYRWQYFYRSTILHDTDSIATAPAHYEHFAAIFTAYGRVLVHGNDPHVAKLILSSLQNLNERYKLFTREFFVTNFIGSFQCAVISSLMLPGGGVLHTEMDNLLNLLYAMSIDNRWQLQQSFESLGFQKEMCQDVVGAQDLPTFVQVMGRLIQDTRCKQLEQ